MSQAEGQRAPTPTTPAPTAPTATSPASSKSDRPTRADGTLRKAVIGTIRGSSTQSDNVCYINKLPDVVLVQIFDLINEPNVRLVCKRWKFLFDDSRPVQSCVLCFLSLN